MLICLFHSPAIYRERALLYKFSEEKKFSIIAYYHDINFNELDQYPDTIYLKSQEIKKNSLINLSLWLALWRAKFCSDKESSFVWIAGWNNRHNIQAIIVCSILRIPFMLWTDTINTDIKRKIWKRKIRKMFLNQALNNAYLVGTTGVPGINAFARENFFYCDPKKFIDFPLYIDLDKYDQYVRSTKKIFKNSLINMVCVGWIIDKRKGQSIILHALFNLSRYHNFKMTFVGLGSDTNMLIQMTNRLGLIDKVSFVGGLSPRKVAELYQNSDILIHAAPTHEPYGVVIQEAMAAGLVVFASNKTCAALDVIESGNNGFIHNAGDSEMLFKQLKYLLDNPSTFTKIKKKSYETSKKWDLNKGLIQLDWIIKNSNINKSN